MLQMIWFPGPISVLWYVTVCFQRDDIPPSINTIACVARPSVLVDFGPSFVLSFRMSPFTEKIIVFACGDLYLISHEGCVPFLTF